MGLDGVELLMATEETFQITFTDQEASKMVTVGDLYAQILSKLAELHFVPCLTSYTFYRLRRTLINVLGIQRNQFYPKQKIEYIFPKKNRRAQWHVLSKRLNFRLPELQRPKWIFGFLTFGLCFWLVGSILGNIFGFLTPLQTWISIILSLIFAWSVYRISKPLAVYFRTEISTLAEMIEEIVRFNFGKANDRVKQWNDDKDIWKSLKCLIVEQLGVKPEEVIESARFVEDLGID